MHTMKERFATMQDALSFLGNLEPQAVSPTLCAPYGDDLSGFGFEQVKWAPYIWQSGGEPLPKDHELFTDHRVFAIGLASVLACLQLELRPGSKVLDMCAAPGIKSLYLQLIHDKKLNLYVNDVSHDRLVRLRLLFEQFSVPLPQFTKQAGQSLLRAYDKHSFDAVIIDAPCSGEGNILAGDAEALKTWSPAKVRRLADLQRKLIKTGLSLVKPEGQLLYATCTLNTHENETALRKAGVGLGKVETGTIDFRQLTIGEGYRLLPSENSIGFFVSLPAVESTNQRIS